MVLGPGWQDGFKWTHRTLACSVVESKQSEVAGAQELACALSCHPLTRARAAPLAERCPRK